MAESTERQPSLLGRVATLAIGSALAASELVEGGVNTALEVNRRVWGTVERAAEPFVTPFESLGVTKAVRRQVDSITVSVTSVVSELEEKGRNGLIVGENPAADVITGIIDSVLDYLKQNPEVTKLIDAQVERLMPVLGSNPAVQALVRDQVAAILPDLVNDPAVQTLIRAQAGQYIAYLQSNPDLVQPLIRQQGNIYIDYLNDHPAPVQTLVQGQSLSMAGQMRDEVRERTVTGDSVVEAIVRNIFRLKPREELPPPSEEIQRRAESGRLPADFAKGQQNGAA